jgi:heme A synthase
MAKLPLFSTQTRKRIAYAILAGELFICAGALGWVIVLQRSLPPAMLSPAFAMWIAVPFIILGSIAREEKAAREGRQIEGPTRRPWLMLSLGILGVVIALGAVLILRR